MNALEVDIKYAGYPGEASIINNIQFEVKKGELVGLIGSNGSGKSTTIKGILDMLVDFEGTINFGQGEGKKYAYIPEHPSFYDELTLWEHLELAASLSEMSPGKWETRAMKIIDDFNMKDAIHQLPATFSKGMQQKIMIILAMLIEPHVYIVDEPFIGLDPRSTKQFLNYVRREKERGAGILMSTHVLDTAERHCDRLVLINQGEVVINGTMAEIREKADMQDGSLMDCFDRLMGW
ncbi:MULTISPECIES: ABC transporter ATP-binding protein [Bacillaceae]|uniref:ABC transporter ATP-binding protein n=1 Tax=Evansella alkalicola TaxID=745819 RepID=A0ABS6JQE8_9BACI|nr:MULTISPECIES: ABC transporter ATP-binding protein [Bacillaceae]MBU9720789.1 ABC transporter ATP-binding protein [Bacillus alkalicola]